MTGTKWIAWCRRGAVLLATGGLLLGGVGASDPATPAARATPVLIFTQPAAEEVAEEAVEMGMPEVPLPTVRVLLRLPPEGGTAVVSDGAGGQWLAIGDGETAILSAPPGDYQLSCGRWTAELTLDAQGGVIVHRGEAAWDGEQLVIGGYGTLSLCCRMGLGQQQTLLIEAAGETYSRTAAYDPALATGRSCEVVYDLALPAGAVTITVGGRSQRVVLQLGQTLRVEL